MENRKRFSLFDCKTVSWLHGYFLSENGERIISYPIISAREGKTWVNALMENGTITEEEALLLEKDIQNSGLPDESHHNLTATVLNGESNLIHYALFGMQTRNEICTIINKKTINESGIHGDQEPWMWTPT